MSVHWQGRIGHVTEACVWTTGQWVSCFEVVRVAGARFREVELGVENLRRNLLNLRLAANAAQCAKPHFSVTSIKSWRFSKRFYQMHILTGADRASEDRAFLGRGHAQAIVPCDF